MSRQLVYSEFGDPMKVVKYREVLVPELQPQEVLVRMLAAPVNPADINTIQGILKRHSFLLTDLRKVFTVKNRSEANLF